MPNSVRPIATADAPAAIGPYSQAVVAGGFLFSAGQIPLDPKTGEIVPGDVVEQSKQVLANLAAVLKAERCWWGDVVKTTVFLTDMADFPKFNEVYAATLGTARPARSTVHVSALPRGVNVEVELVAKLPV